MRPSFRLFAAVALAASLAASRSHAAPGTTTGTPAASDPAAARLAERRAWAEQVRALRAQERTELDSLARALGTQAPGAELARGQRELEAHKRAWRRRLLQAQLERAQAAGTPANAARLRVRLDELDAASARRTAPRSAAPVTPAAGGAR